MSATTELLPLVGILIPATISPGPNNSIVLHAAVKNGLAAALPHILAVITGSAVLFAITSMSLGVSAQNIENVRLFIIFLGAAYLAWLGLAMFNTTTTHNCSDLSSSVLPNTFLSISLFQIANPKSWVMMGIVSAHGSHNIHWFILLFTITAVFGFSLTIWAIAGSVLSEFLQTPRIKVVFNKTMGATLIFFAAMLLFQMN